MKKALIIVVLLCTLVALVACNNNGDGIDNQDKDIVDNNKVVVKVIEYCPGAINTITPYQEVYVVNDIEIEKGTAFTYQTYVDYLKSIGKSVGGFCGGEFIGFFKDNDFRIKYNTDLLVEKDITLYFTEYSIETDYTNYCMISFHFQNDVYKCALGFDQWLNEDTFPISAYGKEIDKTKCRYYYDTEHTKEVELGYDPIIRRVDYMDLDGHYLAELDIYVVLDTDA